MTDQYVIVVILYEYCTLNTSVCRSSNVDPIIIIIDGSARCRCRRRSSDSSSMDLIIIIIDTLAGCCGTVVVEIVVVCIPLSLARHGTLSFCCLHLCPIIHVR